MTGKLKLYAVVLVLGLFFALLAGGAFAAEKGNRLRIGLLSKLNMTQSDYHNFMVANIASGRMRVFSKTGDNHQGSNVLVAFYDSLIALQLGLEAGEIDEISLPDVIAEYVMNKNEGRYEISCITKLTPASLALGFKNDVDPALLNKINSALLSMKEDGTLAVLIDKYVENQGLDDPEPVKIEKYDNIKDKIRVAVTGDLPPIDFIASDGTPAGFNTAVIAEIGRRAKINVEIMDIESGARAAVLASGRADAVFWFQTFKNVKVQPDVPNGIVLSEPYYNWNEYLHIVKK